MTDSVKTFTFTPKSSVLANPEKVSQNTVMPADYSTAADLASANGGGGGEGRQDRVHSGPPSSNVEILLKGIDEDAVEDRGEDAVGDVWVGGPGVVGGQAETGLRAKALKNGCFVVVG